MTLDLTTLCDLARRGGVAHVDVPLAAACAMTASGGNAHYHRTAGPPSLGDWRGLWAVDVAAYPDCAELDLWNPAVAAACCADLTRLAGGFGWCYTYRTGVFGPYMAAAETAATVVGHRPAGVNVSTIPTGRARIESNYGRHAAILDRLRIARHRRH